jgi:hypothetical protein
MAKDAAKPAKPESDKAKPDAQPVDTGAQEDAAKEREKTGGYQ